MKQIEDKPKTRISKVLRVQARDVDILKTITLNEMEQRLNNVAN